MSPCRQLPRGPTHAAERQALWLAGGSISFRSNLHGYRSNASVAIGPLGAEGIPYTFDVGETTSCLGPDAFCDPRPDYLLNDPATIRDAYQYEIHAGYMPLCWS